MVTLSGGDMGGEQVDGAGWAIGSEKPFGSLRYRRDSDTFAVFVGMVQ